MLACLGEKEAAVDGQHEEEEDGKGAMKGVRDVHGYLEESHEGVRVQPADVAWEQHDAQA